MCASSAANFSFVEKQLAQPLRALGQDLEGVPVRVLHQVTDGVRRRRGNWSGRCAAPFASSRHRVQASFMLASLRPPFVERYWSLDACALWNSSPSASEA